MIRAFSVFLLLSFLPAYASADAREDAEIIVEITVTDELFAAAMTSLAGLMSGSIQNEMRKSGKTITNDAASTYANMLGDSMTEFMGAEMRPPLVEAYIENVSPEALHAYRLFLETKEGQEIISKQGLMMLESMKVGEMIGEKVAIAAVAAVEENMTANEWPEGTLLRTQAELRKLFVDE